MLPRSVDNCGIVIVTEHLENLNITREFSVSRDNVFEALTCLVANNSLYKDVLIDNNANLSTDDLILVFENACSTSQTIFQSEVQNNQDFLQINDVSRILQASWHQGNVEVFTSDYSGVQCCAIAMKYESGNSLLGSLRDSINRNSIGLPLKDALCSLFLTHQTGIFITAVKSFGIICYDQKFYLTDSHSCGPKGARANNGKACVIECTTVDELCKRVTSSQNVPYTLTYVAVTNIPIISPNHTPISTPLLPELTRNQEYNNMNTCTQKSNPISEEYFDKISSKVEHSIRTNENTLCRKKNICTQKKSSYNHETRQECSLVRDMQMIKISKPMRQG
ncbi:ATP-dependent DNA helicase [Trichonephila clavipes]|nr:ATP-dependent DNA helicase [Trichonephila clavipes]